MTTKQAHGSEKALRLRRRVKKTKSDFARPESWRYIRLKENWRRPRGLDNKMRRKIKGWPPTVNVGYRGPRIARGLHPSGYREVLVHTPADIEKIDPKTQIVRIAHVVGKRKRARIIADARKKRIAILNVKEVRTAAKEEEPEEKTEEKEEKKEEIEKAKETTKPKGKRTKTKKREGVTKEQ